MRKKRNMIKATVKREVREDTVIRQEVVSNEDNLVVAGGLAKDTTQIFVKNENQIEINVEVEIDSKPFLETQDCNIGGNIQSTSFSHHVKKEQSVEDMLCKKEEVTGDNKIINTQDCLDIEETQLVDPKLMTSSAELIASADNWSIVEKAGPKISKKPYKCNLCEKSFVFKSNLKIHSLVHSDDRPYECDMCGFKSKTLGNLREHMKIHSGVKYKCDTCQRKYSHRSTYLSHIKNHTHNLSKKITCEICNKSLNKSVIEAHMRKHYNYTYMCDHCNYKTTIKAHIRRHMQKHGFMTFICDICHKSLSDNRTLKIHKLTHTEIKPYKCDDCQKSFAQPYFLKNHQASHLEDTPFKCEMCNYESKIKANFLKHIGRHKKVRQHECDFCSFAFKNAKSLQKHKLCHTENDEKPFRCEICCKSFRCKGNLAQHEKTISHIRALENESLRT